MAHICSECLGQTEYFYQGHDNDGKIFNLYVCKDCGSYNREFYAPIEKVALESTAYSANIVQMRMFPAARVSD